MEPSLSAWRQFLERLPEDHPLRRVVLESAETTVEEAVLRLAAIVESSDDAILSKTLDGRILSWNAGAERIYGYRPSEVVGRSISILIPPGRPDDTAEILERIRAGEGVDHYETERIRKDGRVIDVSLTVSPVRDTHGQITAASTIARDITERKREERRLQFLADASSALSSSLDFETTLRNLADLAVPRLADWCTVDVTDEDGSLRRVALSQGDPSRQDEAAELGEKYPPPDPTRHPIGDALRARHAKLITHIDCTFWRPIALDERHYQLLCGFNFSSAIITPLIARERLLGVLTFAQTGNHRQYDQNDLALTEELGRRAAMAIDNARLYGEAQAANRSKDEFLATLSHELRTPLTPILGWTRILRAGKTDPATTQRALEVIERNVKAQSALINDLLDLSRIASGKLRLDLKPVDLAAILESAVDAIRPTAEARGIVLDTQFEASTGLVSADADRIRQVAWNLLTNAVKFTPRGGRVCATLGRSHSSIELKVEDTGEGIPREFLPFIFNRFHQADSSTTRTHGGLGLGLAIVRHLVELHGGTVQAESEGPGRGSTFTVRLPLLAALPTRLSKPVSKEAQGEPGDTGDLHGLRVLVVDDEQDAREFLQMLLQMRGAEVEIAASAGAAIRTLAAWRPDLIVADIGMPGMDGYEMMAEIRRRPPEAGGETPAIALTAYARQQDREQAIKAGFQAHLAKPVEPAALLETLSRFGGRTEPRPADI